MMGLLDKAKFWKKPEEEAGDLSDLGDFGFDDKPSAGGKGAGGLGDDLSFPPLGEVDKPGMQPGVPTHIEEVHPTDASRQMSDQLGIKPAPQQGYGQQFQQQAPNQGYPSQQPVQQFQQPQQQFAPQFQQGPALSDMAKDMEIIHAKLDAIKSSLDSMNQRLATLERIASGDTGRQRYAW
jgi:hypothetical protein